MKDKNLKGYLQQSLGEEVQPKRLEETIKLCTEIVREQEVTRDRFLSLSFRRISL